MNLILGMALKHNVVLGDPALVAYAERRSSCPGHRRACPPPARRLQELDQERCYSADILHRLGDLALLRCLEDWRQGGGALDDEVIGESLYAFGAAYGSSLRARWRLPLELRQLIAAIYSLEGGVYSREALVVNLAAQMARLTEYEGLEALAGSKTARLLKVGLSELMRVRKPSLSRRARGSCPGAWPRTSLYRRGRTGCPGWWCPAR